MAYDEQRAEMSINEVYQNLLSQFQYNFDNFRLDDSVLAFSQEKGWGEEPAILFNDDAYNYKVHIGINVNGERYYSFGGCTKKDFSGFSFPCSTYRELESRVCARVKTVMQHSEDDYEQLRLF